MFSAAPLPLSLPELSQFHFLYCPGIDLITLKVETATHANCSVLLWRPYLYPPYLKITFIILSLSIIEVQVKVFIGLDVLFRCSCDVCNDYRLRFAQQDNTHPHTDKHMHTLSHTHTYACTHTLTHANTHTITQHHYQQVKTQKRKPHNMNIQFLLVSQSHMKWDTYATLWARCETHLKHKLSPWK